MFCFRTSLRVYNSSLFVIVEGILLYVNIPWPIGFPSLNKIIVNTVVYVLIVYTRSYSPFFTTEDLTVFMLALCM